MNRLPSAVSLSNASAQIRFLASDSVERRKMIEENIFPDSAQRHSVKLECGTFEIEGIYEGVSPAFVRIWSVEGGIVDVPIHLLPPELIRCFPNEPEARYEAEIAGYKETCATYQATLAASVSTLKQIEQSTAETTQQILAEVRDLLRENEALRKRIQELEGNLA